MAGSYVSLFFRRPQAARGLVNYFYYNVELMRGSVDFINENVSVCVCVSEALLEVKL